MAGRRLTLEERQLIEAYYVAGFTFPQIAERLGRDRTTIWREVQRNNSARHGPKSGRPRPSPGYRQPGYRWGYRAGRAHAAARTRARRPRSAKCAAGGVLREIVLEKLRLRWSPRQIAAWLRDEHPDRPELWVSHETIYQAIYVQSRGNLRAEVGRQVALRSGRAARRPQATPGGAVRSRRAWISDAFRISARPAEAADRAVPGHWEGDLLVGRGGTSAIITLVERATRYVMLGALPDGRASEAVIDVLAGLAQRLPAHLHRSLTWDQGVELAQHATFTVATGCPVYFCDPHSPWQRGSNENTNGLLRQYFPKGVTDFRTLTQADLDAVAHELNGRPRQTLGWKNPAQALDEFLVATAD
jgi:IS30 family transposase